MRPWHFPSRPHPWDNRVIVITDRADGRSIHIQTHAAGLWPRHHLVPRILHQRNVRDLSARARRSAAVGSKPRGDPRHCGPGDRTEGHGGRADSGS